MVAVEVLCPGEVGTGTYVLHKKHKLNTYDHYNGGK